MTDTEIGERLIAMNSGVNMHRVRTGMTMDEQQRSAVTRAFGMLSERPIYIDDHSNGSLHDVLARARSMYAERAIDMLVVDYLQLMHVDGNAKHVNRTQEVGQMSAALKSLARELNMDQVAEIHKTIIEEQLLGRNGSLVRIEMFCHGALCMAVSGKCYLSLHEMNASANRGSCMQVCRRGYTVHDKDSNIELDIDNEYIMSPKDLKTIHFLNKMIDSGVRVFKIEGRARGPEYVKTVVTCYREAIESYLDNSFTDDKIDGWDERLSRVFNRGFWNGYYLGQRLGEWSHNYGSEATRRKMYVGKCTNYFSKIGVAEFLLESQELAVGDEILVTGATTGAYEDVVQAIHVELQPVERVGKGTLFSIKTNEPIRRNDKLYKMVVVQPK